jgi:hypothetical protein
VECLSRYSIEEVQTVVFVSPHFTNNQVGHFSVAYTFL